MESNLFFPAFHRVFELSVQRQDAEAGPKSDAQPAHQRDRYYHERAVHQALLNMYLGSSPWPMGMALMEVGNV